MIEPVGAAFSPVHTEQLSIFMWEPYENVCNFRRVGSRRSQVSMNAGPRNHRHRAPHAALRGGVVVCGANHQIRDLRVRLAPDHSQVPSGDPCRMVIYSEKSVPNIGTFWSEAVCHRIAARY